MKNSVLLLILAVILLFVAPQLAPKAGYTIEQFGFGSGFLHGLLSLFTFIGSFFSKTIVVMAKNHTFMYSVGFYVAAVLSWPIAIAFIFSVVFGPK